MRRLRAIIVGLTAFLTLCFAVVGAGAVEPIAVPLDVPALDLTHVVELRTGVGERLQVSTAPGPDGIVRRIEVRAVQPGDGDWVVFALKNNTDEQIDRLLVAPFFRLADSGVLSPDLGASRIQSISTSQGLAPERQVNQEADVFLVTLDPRTVVTVVLELKSPRLPKLVLWEPDAYKDSVNAYTLFRGIILGISGLLALFLTILFVVKGSAMFPATAAMAWAVLGYLCIDFGFWDKLFRLQSGADQVYRAGAEVMLATTLVLFLYAYLNLNRWHVSYSHMVAAAVVVLLGLVGVAVIDPTIASGIARIVLGVLAVVGAGLIAYLAAHGYDRAIMLIPTWVLLTAWLLAAGLTVSGGLDNDAVQPALAAGLVLIVMLIGFTVMQHAFAGGGITQGASGETERRALALLGSGDMIWDWDVSRDHIWASPEVEDLLGVEPGTLESAARDWLEILHPKDRDPFRSTLDAVVEQRRGRVSVTFRLRCRDGHFRWFKLRARPVIGSDGEVIRCVGTLIDVTDTHTAEERLLHDAVHDNLTGLPNRELFFDRITSAIVRARAEGVGRPSLIIIDIDRFKNVNDSLGLSIGDSMLLTVARRLARQVKPQDTLARIDGDQFGVVVISESEPERIAAFADGIRRTLKAPITLGEREVFLTTSIGVAIFDAATKKEDDLVKDAEIAMYHAKRLGGDRIEVFRASLRQHAVDILAIESDLRRALEREEIKVFYQPIIRLADDSIAGFEALARWEHPKRGRLGASEFISIAERSGLIIPLGLLVLEKAARQLSAWQEEYGSDLGVFCSVNVSSRQLLRHDLINDVKAVLSRVEVARGTLKIEVTESLVMENPEYAAKVLERIKELGTSLALDDFGTGYSSLSYLQRFPFDSIKIDQSFVRGTAKERPVLLRSIVTLAHDLGMDVIAEGAETPADVEQLKALGCEYAQGWALGEPMPAEDARRLLGRSLRAAAQ
ncbi:EAL domain-containing protein [Siculibacillus lacustris]|uniref:EAL domain-containing protein n=1 Tax=Siculibacillus lacustris TaxID=1549641 RepID=UPI0026D91084